MKVLVTAPYNDKGLEELRAVFGEVDYRTWKEVGRAFLPNELIDMLQKKAYDVFITEHDDVDRSVIDSCPSLKLIGVCRGTPSNVDVAYAKEKGITVVNTPGRNAQAVAEMFIANVITFYRKTIVGRQWLIDGKWADGAHTSYLEFKGNELAGKVVGMVGFGAVGQHIARMLEAFPATVQYYDPFYTDSNTAFKSVSLETIFATSDIVAINLPVNDATKGMIDGSLISLMKADALFVNMSRAVVVNRADLIDAIENEKIRGAIVDVFNHEPPDAEDYRIIRHPNVLATPHIAGATFEVEDHHVVIMKKQIDTWLKENK